MPFKNKHLGENIIIADADYVDKVAFNLIVNFERMIGRHIPQADMAQWVECIALDGGCQEKPAEASTPLTSVILIHDVAKREMDNFSPGIFGDNLPPAELARLLDTIPYEILTSVSDRVKRIYFQ